MRPSRKDLLTNGHVARLAMRDQSLPNHVRQLAKKALDSNAVLLGLQEAAERAQAAQAQNTVTAGAQPQLQPQNPPPQPGAPMLPDPNQPPNPLNAFPQST